MLSPTLTQRWGVHCTRRSRSSPASQQRVLLCCASSQQMMKCLTDVVNLYAVYFIPVGPYVPTGKICIICLGPRGDIIDACACAHIIFLFTAKILFRVWQSLADWRCLVLTITPDGHWQRKNCLRAFSTKQLMQSMQWLQHKHGMQTPNLLPAAMPATTSFCFQACADSCNHCAWSRWWCSRSTCNNNNTRRQ